MDRRRTSRGAPRGAARWAARNLPTACPRAGCRCHRDSRFAQVYWAYADDTIEERIAQVVARRIQSMKEMIGDDVETLREIERLLVGA